VHALKGRLQLPPGPYALSGLAPHTGVCDMIVCMQVDRFSVTMEPDLGAACGRRLNVLA